MAKTVDFFDGSTTVSVPTIGNVDTSALLVYADDASYEAANAGSPALGNIYVNSTNDTVRYYNGTSWVDLATVDELVAASIAVTPTGNLTADDVQEGLEDHQTNLDTLNTDVGNNTTNIGTNTTNIGTNTTNIGTNDTDITNLQNDKLDASEKGAANGVAELDGTGLVPVAQLPAIAISSVSVVGSEAAMIALVAQEGDVAKRTDEGVSYIHNGGTAGDATDWTIVHDAFAGANDTLSNLTTTSINQDLLPGGDVNKNLGSSSLRWNNVYGDDIFVNSTITFEPGGGADTLEIGNALSPFGANLWSMYSPRSGIAVGMHTKSQTSGAVDSSDVLFGTGNAVDGDSGDLRFRAGTISGTGNRGKIEFDADHIDATTAQIKNVANPTAAQDVATKDYVDGLAGGSGANTSLSNLTNPTSVNQDLNMGANEILGTGKIVPDDMFKTLGSTSKWWVTLYASNTSFGSVGSTAKKGQIEGGSSGMPGGINGDLIFKTQINGDNLGLNTVSSNESNPSGDILINTGNDSSAAGSGSGDIALYTGTSTNGTRGKIDLHAEELDMNSVKITALAEPTASSDAATKNYVDTNGGGTGTDLVYETLSSTDTLDSANQMVLCNASLGGFTVNLPQASTVDNQRYWIFKTDSTFNAVTIDAYLSETINGSTTTTLNTEYECIELLSVGTGWLLIRRDIPSEMTSYTPTNTQGFGTLAASNLQWRRVGDSIQIQGNFTTGTVTASQAQIELPGSLAIGGISGQRIHVGNLTRGGAAGPYAVVGVQARTYVTFGTGAASQGDVNGNTLLGSAENVLLSSFLIPISGWNG